MDQDLTIRFGFKAVIFDVLVVLILTHMIQKGEKFSQLLRYFSTFQIYGLKKTLEELLLQEGNHWNK